MTATGDIAPYRRQTAERLNRIDPAVQ